MRRTLPILLALALLGCATERPTRPLPETALPATPISSSLVASKVGPIAGVRLADSAVLIDFGQDVLRSGSVYSDVAIRLDSDKNIVRDTLRVQDPSSGQWLDVQGAFPMTSIYIGPFHHVRESRLLSQFQGRTPQSFLDSHGAIRMLVPRAVTVEASWVEYLPDYIFATIHLSRTATLFGLTYAQGSLYTCISDGVHDTLMAFDLCGKRRWALGFEQGWPSGSTFDGTAFWICAEMSLSEPRLLKMDTLGNILASIPITERMQAMCQYHGSIFYESRRNIYALDVDSTLKTGTEVRRSLFPSPFGRVVAMDATEGGLSIAVISPDDLSTSIMYFSLYGELRSTILPRARGIEGLEWNGESLWILHHGPDQIGTSATLLTRFTLE